MLDASGAGARLDGRAIPLLPGVADLVAAGVESTLAPANRERTGAVSLAGAPSNAALAALADPQTCGGLLIGVAPGDADALVDALRAAGYENATAIGDVTASAVGIRID
ncbi:MAG: AIR synthase-related protein, partial [Vicinamibacteria bacterium]